MLYKILATVFVLSFLALTVNLALLSHFLMNRVKDIDRKEKVVKKPNRKPQKVEMTEEERIMSIYLENIDHYGTGIAQKEYK